MLKKGMAMEASSQDDYNKAALECSANADAVTKQVFEALIADEERHFDQYEKEMEKIQRFGPSYLALQSFGSAAEPGPGKAGAAE
jgi:bacterioferritin